MKTSDWHKLIKPVIPHALNDASCPEINCIRIEVTGGCVYAVATDRYTLGVERKPIDLAINLSPVHLQLTDARSSLALFPFSKDDDPELRIVIDTVSKPVKTRYGREEHIGHLGITIDSEYGTRLVMHDTRDPSSDPHGKWQAQIRSAITRTVPLAGAAIALGADHLAKWGAATRRGERLAMFTGDKDDRVILVLVEDHFAGLWAQPDYLEGPDKILAGSPWAEELLPATDARQKTP
jgi:hypothetical protein